AAQSQAPVLLVRTKIDLDGHGPRHDEHGERDPQGPIGVSAETGEGLSALINRIGHLIRAADGMVDMDAPWLTHARQRYAIDRAIEEVTAFREAWRERSVPAPIAAVHVHAAVRALEDLVGSIEIEDVLDEVFRRFCVGK